MHKKITVANEVAAEQDEEGNITVGKNFLCKNSYAIFCN